MKKATSSILLMVASFFSIGYLLKPTATKTIDNIKYSFFVAGHTYGAPGVDNVGVHPPFSDTFSYIRDQKSIKFGIFTGDIVLSGTEKNWDEIDSEVAELNMPIHFAVGNHDVIDRPLYEARYGATFSNFIHEADLFILLDPNIDQWNISGEQLEFLKATLDDKANKVDNIFVFFHQMLWWSPDNKYKNIRVNSLEGRADNINFWEEVEPLFKRLPNDIYMFSGDVGARSTGSEVMYDTYDNITLIASGMGGNSRDNLIIVDVSNDNSTSFRLVALNGDDRESLGTLESYVLP